MTLRWPNRPYKGLAKYSMQDSALFVGREEEVKRCAQRLNENDIYLFVLHGLSGTGKSSFLQAGLLPYLEALPDSRLKMTASERPNGNKNVVIRAGSSPLEAIAQTLYDLIDSLLKASSNSKDTIKKLSSARLGTTQREGFVEKAGSSAEQMLRTVDRLSSAISGRLLLVVDQAEEIFLSDNDRSRQRGEFFDFLHKLCSYRPEVKLLIGMRSDFKAKFDEELSERDVDPWTVSNYYLEPIGNNGILKAILRPTIRKPIDFGVFGELPAPYDQPNYGFSFEKGLPEVILSDLVSNTEPSSRLPVLQVICDRLHARLGKKGKRLITFEAYRAAGAGNAQVASHIEDRIVMFLSEVNAQSGGMISLGMEADRWKTVLWECAHVQSDGRVTARPAIDDKELIKIAGSETSDRVNPEAMLTWLAKEENYILERVPGTVAAKPHGWRLLHDSVAAALVHWHNAEGAHRNLAIVDSDPMLDTALPTYIQRPEAAPVTLSTINDLIWDHQIALYAQSKGFAQRLGFAFEVEEEFDLTKVRGEIDYSKFVSRQGNGRSRMIVMPSFLMRAVQKEPWTTIGVTNLYRGYAIIGQSITGLKPVRGQHDNKTLPSRQSRMERLQELATILSRPEKRIGVFEERSEQFVNFVLQMNGFKPRKDLRQLGVDSEGKPVTSTRDLLFSALVKNELDFGLGPAPSRALAEQAGFAVYADFEDVYELASDPEKEALKKLLMHEVWAVNVPKSDEATLLRLAALMFYTVDYIRRNPEDFISFVHDQMLLALSDGAYWLQRKFIRAAVESCYSYTSSNDYAFRYGTRNPLDTEDQDALALHGRWTELRGLCDQSIARLAKVHKDRWPPGTEDVFDRGERQYRIYNFYDAYHEFLNTEHRLGLP